MSQIDSRELNYREIFQLDKHSSTYYQDLVNLISLMMTDKERDELTEKIFNLREMLDNGTGELPSFFVLENAFYNMKTRNRSFIKLKLENGFKKITFMDLSQKFYDLQQFCFIKLRSLQKDIRFSNINSASP